MISDKGEQKQQIVGREIDQLIEKHGSITPKLVLDTARDRKHPLHRFFTWDDSKAAEKWRLREAHAMIMAQKQIATLRSSDTAAIDLVRHIVPINIAGGFATRDIVLSRRESRDAFIERMRERVRSWCREVTDVQELQPLRTCILSCLAAEDLIEHAAE